MSMPSTCLPIVPTLKILIRSWDRAAARGIPFKRSSILEAHLLSNQITTHYETHILFDGSSTGVGNCFVQKGFSEYRPTRCLFRRTGMEGSGAGQNICQQYLSRC